MYNIYSSKSICQLCSSIIYNITYTHAWSNVNVRSNLHHFELFINNIRALPFLVSYESTSNWCAYQPINRTASREPQFVHSHNLYMLVWCDYLKQLTFRVYKASKVLSDLNENCVYQLFKIVQDKIWYEVMFIPI